MAAETKQIYFEGSAVSSFQVYLEQSGEHKAVLQCVHSILPGEFKRIGAGKSSLDVLGLGSGGGELDVQMLTLLQSTFPAVPITADIVDVSTELTDNFKALVAKTPNLETVPFAWHIMSSGDYEKQVKAKGDMKKFDFIHMIQMIYSVDDLAGTIQFYQSILKNNGRLMVINDTVNNGWDILWKTFQLCHDGFPYLRTSADIIACVESLGLKYEEHFIPISFDITECFNPNSETGRHLLSALVGGRDDFYQSFTPEIRAGILDLLRNKCSIKKDGRVFFNADSSCILIHA